MTEQETGVENFYLELSSRVKSGNTLENEDFLIEVDFSHAFWKEKLHGYLIFRNCRFWRKVTVRSGGFRFESECVFLDEVVFSNSTRVYIENCTFEGVVTFDKLLIGEDEKNRKLRILGTHFLHKVRFQHCNFNTSIFYGITFSGLEIERCYFMGVSLNHIQWPKYENIQSDRDGLRQIKSVLHEHENHLDANLFHSLEMDAYKDELCKTKFFDRFEDKAVFWLSYMVSKFSQSWLLPLFWFFAIGFGFFFFFDAAYQGLLSGSFCDRFWQFVNPLSDAISDKAAAYKGAYSFWFLHKLISGFIVYHFIVALRRKTRNI